MAALSALSGAVQDIGSAIGAFGQAGIDQSEANAFTNEALSYGNAEQIALNNEAITESSTAIQEYQTQRQAMQVIGTQKADVAGAGFAESGSSLALLRSSTQQANIAKALVGEQGQIEENAFAAQASAYAAQAQAAEAASSQASASSSLSDMAGIFDIAGGLVGFL